MTNEKVEKKRHSKIPGNRISLIDDARCFETVQAMRWHDGLNCPESFSSQLIKDGRDDTQPERQPYRCHGCGKRFDDLSGTIFAGHHQPLRGWLLCLYCMGLNRSKDQISLRNWGAIPTTPR